MVGLGFQNELMKILVAVFVLRGNNQNTSAGFALHNSVLVFFFFFRELCSDCDQQAARPKYEKGLQAAGKCFSEGLL